jgi:hypothetical protein
MARGSADLSMGLLVGAINQVLTVRENFVWKNKIYRVTTIMLLILFFYEMNEKLQVVKSTSGDWIIIVWNTDKGCICRLTLLTEKCAAVAFGLGTFKDTQNSV